MEFNGVLDFVDFVLDSFSVSHGHWVFTHLDENITEKLGDLFGDTVGGDKDIVLLGPLFDFGLLLVEGFETIDIDIWDFEFLTLVNMDGISHDTDLNCNLLVL